MNDAPQADAYALIERLAALLDEAHAMRCQIEDLQDSNESAGANAERTLCFALTTAIEAGLVRVVEDLMMVLRKASQPRGPIGAEWLARQERR